MPNIMVIVVLIKFFLMFKRPYVFTILNPSMVNHTPTQNKIVSISVRDI